MKLNNKYYILRHGEAISNVRQVVSSWPEKFKNPLTERGIEIIKESANKLKDKNISLIFSSDLLRTKQTAKIVGKALKIHPVKSAKGGVSQKAKQFNWVKPKFDKRLREISFGVLNGRPITDLNIDFSDERKRIKEKIPEGESYEDVLKRVFDFLMDIDKKYQGETILIVSHECPLWILESKLKGMSLMKYLREVPRDERIHKGQIKELN